MPTHPAQVLAGAVNFFLYSGYDALFANDFINFNHEKRLFGVGHMHALLHEFYHTLETSISVVPSSTLARSRLQRLRLLHTVTMLNLLRVSIIYERTKVDLLASHSFSLRQQFRKFRVISSGMNLLHWKLHIVVSGIFMSVFNSDPQPVKEEDKIVDFMALMTELLFYDMSSKKNVRWV